VWEMGERECVRVQAGREPEGEAHNTSLSNRVAVQLIDRTPHTHTSTTAAALPPPSPLLQCSSAAQPCVSTRTHAHVCMQPTPRQHWEHGLAECRPHKKHTQTHMYTHHARAQTHTHTRAHTTRWPLLCRRSATRTACGKMEGVGTSSTSTTEHTQRSTRQLSTNSRLLALEFVLEGKLCWQTVRRLRPVAIDPTPN
jgi:hypothetical protein